MFVGQSCIAPDYVFVPRKLKKAFTDECARVAKGFYGDAPSTTADYGRIVNDRHMSRLAKVIDASRGHILYGGDYDLAKKYIEPTLVDATTASPSMQEELFGPVLPVVEYDDIDSAIEYINSQPKPLALYIFSSNSSFQQRVLNTTSAGGVSINDVMMHFANANLPFGGVGNSGMGAYHGKHGYETFSHAKSVLNKSLSVGHTNTKAWCSWRGGCTWRFVCIAACSPLFVMVICPCVRPVTATLPLATLRTPRSTPSCSASCRSCTR